ncbi:MAG TPA: sodium:solute symporter family protein [Porticoccaceae bacterium]|jgi:SSS family solute:Na+ symporter|nr:sodium:solute symporter family protein [Gammaproteobacteria bacterium]HIL61603.1 sodium:solute symporter family protein [Porticoccaceae bacterium]
MSITAIVILLYLGLFAAVGFYLNRRNASASDWAIGGGTLGIGMLAAGVAGTRIGGAGTYGVAGDVIAEGLGHLWYSVNSFAALVLVGLFFVIPYRKLKLVSVGQVFDQRFGSFRCQWLTSLCVQAEYLVVNIIEPYVIGSIISGVTGLPFVVGVLLGGFVIISFTVTGGLKGTAITNVVHCSVIIFGLALVGYIAMQNMGGWSEVSAQASAMLAESNQDEVKWWSFTGIGWATIIALFISATIHTPAASIYANYASSAAKEEYLIPGFFLAGVIAALMPLVAGFIGILTMATYGAESGLSSYLNIAQLAIDTGPILGGIALAAVLAAVISSGAPILLASATMFVNDWVPGSKNFDDEKKLRAYKIVTVVYGSVAAIIAWLGNITSVLQLVLLGFAMVVPPAIAVAFVFYWKRTSEKAAFYGMAAGFSGGLASWLFNALFDGPENANAGGFAQWWYELINYLGEWRDPSFLTLFLPLILIPTISILFPNKEEDQEYSDSFYKKLGRIQRNFSWS